MIALFYPVNNWFPPIFKRKMSSTMATMSLLMASVQNKPFLLQSNRWTILVNRIKANNIRTQIDIMKELFVLFISYLLGAFFYWGI